MSESACATTLGLPDQRYRRLFETALDGILLVNAATAQIEDVNPFLLKVLGYSHEEVLGKKLWELGAFKDTLLSKDTFLELQDTGYIRFDDLPLVTKDGLSVSVEFVSHIYECNGVAIIECNVRDNAKRHIAEIAIKTSDRTLKMLSESNIALLNAETETILLSEYCRIAVETGGYLMAWIGFSDSGLEQHVVKIAEYAHKDGYLELSNSTWAENELGNGPVGQAIRTGEAQFTEDISTDSAMAPWCAEALKHGYRSSIVLPFRLPQGTMACMTIYGMRPEIWSGPERKLLKEIASDLAFGIKALRTGIANAQYQKNLRVSLEQTIQVIAETIGQRDTYTSGHQRRVANLCSAIASELNLSNDRSHGLHLAATIHDLGKIGIPAEILAKSGRLSTMEYGLVKEHVNIGYRIIKDVSFPWPIAQIILQHHEREDGSGYPQGLLGGALLLESKILAVSDVVEAMASHRPYRAKLGVDAALDEITAHRGSLFDSRVVDACLLLFRKKGYEF